MPQKVKTNTLKTFESQKTNLKITWIALKLQLLKLQQVGFFYPFVLFQNKTDSNLPPRPEKFLWIAVHLIRYSKHQPI